MLYYRPTHEEVFSKIKVEATDTEGEQVQKVMQLMEKRRATPNQASSSSPSLC